MESLPDNHQLLAFVSGRVQGVFFRMFVLREAKRLGLNGTVRNLPDGRVKVEAEGPEDSLAELIQCLKTGPQDASVETVQEEWSEPTGGFRDFRIVGH